MVFTRGDVYFMLKLVALVDHRSSWTVASDVDLCWSISVCAGSDDVNDPHMKDGTVN